MNSGDWVESLSALVEDHNHEWSLVYFYTVPKIEIPLKNEKITLEEWPKAV
jgi:hypothetical protein